MSFFLQYNVLYYTEWNTISITIFSHVDILNGRQSCSRLDDIERKVHSHHNEENHQQRGYVIFWK